MPILAGAGEPRDPVNGADEVELGKRHYRYERQPRKSASRSSYPPLRRRAVFVCVQHSRLAKPLHAPLQSTTRGPHSSLWLSIS